MASRIPPAPTRAPPGEFAWNEWYQRIDTLINATTQVTWANVDKAGSSIADLQDHTHNLLTAVQGGAIGEYYHLTAAQHTALTSASQAPVIITADYTVADGKVWIINDKSSACIITLPAASSNTGRVLNFLNYRTFTVTSATANVVPLTGGTPSTVILAAVAGDKTTLVSNGTVWLKTQ